MFEPNYKFNTSASQPEHESFTKPFHSEKKAHVMIKDLAIINHWYKNVLNVRYVILK